MSDETSGALPLSSGLSTSRHRSSSRSGVFIEQQQIRQNDVSYQVDIGRNPSSADSTSTNRSVNARYWLLKRIWETCGMTMYTSVCD